MTAQAAHMTPARQPALFAPVDRPGFRTVLMDPPWMERGGGKSKRGADRHYPLVPTVRLPDVIRSSGLWADVADHAHVYMWVTNNFLGDGLWLLEQLGARYVTNVVWVKTRDDGSVTRGGLGQYFRGAHELMLFGVIGEGFRVRSDRRNLASVITAPLGRHSAKPVESYELIEARSEGPYVEFFARSCREGWTSWGNQVPSEGRHAVPGDP